MATTISPMDRRSRRRVEAMDEAVAHASDIILSEGAGAVSISEVARRMGMKPPSLYKYFPSLHALYDALFARGQRLENDFVADAVRDLEPGLPRLVAAGEACVRWAMTRDGRAFGPLLYWRPIPGFEPSPESFAPSLEFVDRIRADLHEAVQRGELAPWADNDETMRLFSSVIAGICSQQMANQPLASFEDGMFSSLTTSALTMFVRHHQEEPR
ncbi:TetR/AcrR family transcriptional regulator [Gordonia sp. PKS22-38]|uniref:TetR/AcrR family transcriptional regulator n=1 Tax=Gordonia prachuapensis TaxID=3115651 RepID=A0ABU7MY62_9ACTN|nr:TetR/AcrR family transcriptional regulator [Gordonia sp. PKS22-38]